MKVLVTGADGFLGWHTRVRLHALSHHDVVSVGRKNWDRLESLVASADAVLHLAGVNRGNDDIVRGGNLSLAEDLASALRASPGRRRIVFANSIQITSGSPYGDAKFAAAQVLKSAASESGATFVDVILPNLFGEHGKPDYNSFVATFVHRVMAEESPSIQDRRIELLHVQAAAHTLITALDCVGDELRPPGTSTSVGAVLQTLQEQYAVYKHGDIPALQSKLSTDLFNTLRAGMFERGAIPLVKRSDTRGSLVEMVRAHGSAGQTFISTTAPGVTRGQHYHLRKVERFVVVSGEALISLRRTLTDRVVRHAVGGDQPVAIDMPTLWAHNITNVGSSELTTMFWTNELFDPSDADTYAEEV